MEFKDVHGSKVSFLCVFTKKITYGPSNFARNSEEPFWSGPIDAYANEIKTLGKILAHSYHLLIMVVILTFQHIFMYRNDFGGFPNHFR